MFWRNSNMQHFIGDSPQRIIDSTWYQEFFLMVQSTRTRKISSGLNQSTTRIVKFWQRGQICLPRLSFSGFSLWDCFASSRGDERCGLSPQPPHVNALTYCYSFTLRDSCQIDRVSKVVPMTSIQFNQRPSIVGGVHWMNLRLVTGVII